MRLITSLRLALENTSGMAERPIAGAHQPHSGLGYSPASVRVLIAATTSALSSG